MLYYLMNNFLSVFFLVINDFFIFSTNYDANLLISYYSQIIKFYLQI